MDEAIEACRQSTACYPDEVVDRKIAAIEKQEPALQEQLVQTTTKLEEARAAVERGNLEAALTLVREAQAVAPENAEAAQLEQSIEKFISEREAARRQAAEEAARGEELEKQGRWEDAAHAYQRSLALAPSSSIEARLKESRQRIVERDARRAQATRLQNEGQALAVKNDRAGAQYRESLALWPNAKLKKEIAQIVEKMGRETG